MVDSRDQEHAVDVTSGVVPPDTAKKSGVCISEFYTKYRVFCGFSGMSLHLEEYVRKMIVILYV